MILLSKFLLRKQLIPAIINPKLINSQIRTFFNTHKYLRDSENHSDDKQDDNHQYNTKKLDSKPKLDKLNRFGKLIELDKINRPSPSDFNRSQKLARTQSKSELTGSLSEKTQSKRSDKNKDENSIKTLARLINKKNPDHETKELLKPLDRAEKRSKTNPEKTKKTQSVDKNKPLSFNDFASRLDALIDKNLPKKPKDRITDSDSNKKTPVKKKLMNLEDLDGKDTDQRKKTPTSKDDDSNEICDLNSGKGFLIFDNISSIKESKTPESPIWSKYYTDEIVSQSECIPMNGFDEAISLTNEGRLWRFPIDNEQDEDLKEQQIPFHKHVLLEETYLSQFPPIEQVQKFMRLILNGLSQNSFMSLSEKLEVIDWYKRYFADNESIIRDAIEAEDYANNLAATSSSSSSTDNIQARRNDSTKRI